MILAGQQAAGCSVREFEFSAGCGAPDMAPVFRVIEDQPVVDASLGIPEHQPVDIVPSVSVCRRNKADVRVPG
jgi:hypothetical protein